MIRRQQRVLSNILCLTRSAEPSHSRNLGPKTEPIFERLKDHFTVLHNPHPTSRHQARMAILMSLRYAQHFDIKEKIIVAGFLQAALLQPKPGAPPTFSLPVLFVNVYLECGSQDSNVRALAPASCHRWGRLEHDRTPGGLLRRQ
jgi:hypothetical protein